MFRELLSDFLFRISCLFIFLLTSVASSAQTLPGIKDGTWSAAGGEAKVCTNRSCLTLACGQDDNLSLRFNGAKVMPGHGVFRVDGRNVAEGQMNGQRGFVFINVHPRRNADILAKFKRGNRLQVALPSQTVTFGLTGSSAAIDGLVATCSGKVQAVASGRPDYEQRHERQADETTVRLEDRGPLYKEFTQSRNMDIWGNDIRNGLSDPLLKGINEEACGRLCIATENCRAYTWNRKDGEVCFLKTGAGRMSPYQGATSGIMKNDNEVQPPPPTRGPVPVIDDSLGWSGKNPTKRIEQLRAASRPLARSCSEERADLAKLAESFVLPSIPSRGEAGTGLALDWSGNTLIERIPVWLVVSSPQPFRTEGMGSMTLGPEAPGPFGLKRGTGQGRAFVSLWSRGAGEAGRVTVLPLVAGEMELDVALVAWLRGCDEEVVLSEQRQQLRIAPAKATLVLGTPISRQDVTHAVEVPELNRRVIAGLNRIRISSIEGETEVIERAGRGARLSPTGRFLSIEHNGSVEIIDVVDGVMVGELSTDIEQLRWGAGDSVVFGTDAPYATVDLVAPFAAREYADRQITGASCCFAGEDSTHLSFDIENGTVTLRGSFGHLYAPLQGSVLRRESGRTAWDANSGWSPAMQAIALRSIGLVAPIRAMPGFDIPGGAVVAPPEITSIGRELSVAERAPVEQLVEADKKSGPKDSLERAGIQLAQGVEDSSLVDPLAPDRLRNPSMPDKPSIERDELLERLSGLGGEVGWAIDLVETPPGNHNASDCLDYLGSSDNVVNGDSRPGEAATTRQEAFARPGHLALPTEMDQLSMVETTRGKVLVGRLSCASGSTGGTQRGVTALFVLDLQAGKQPLLLRDRFALANGFFASSWVPEFPDFAFDVRAYGRNLVVFTPGNGKIAVIDGETTKVVRDFEDVPSGDLLVDAFLTEDKEHVLQLNRDGGFFVWRLSDGTMALAGRLVDDEVAVWTPDFRFDATAEAAGLIDLRFPGLDEQFSLDRFDPVLNSPGLAEEVLAGRDVPARTLDLPPALAGELAASGSTVTGRAELKAERGATELRIFQDGVLTDSLPVSGREPEGEFSVARLPGARYATMIAYNDAGLASRPVVQDLGSDLDGARGRLLAVATDLYEDARLTDLNFAKADADRIMRSVARADAPGPVFEEPQFVGGRRADPEMIVQAIAGALDGLEARDHLVLFFAGHGLQGQDGKFYLATHGTQTDDLAGTALDFDRVVKLLEGTQSRVTIMIDACHSGEVGNGLFATNDTALRGLSSLPANVTLLAAAKGRQTSKESQELAGGLFSLAIEEVLAGSRERFDLNENGRIEVSELSEGVRSIVSQQTDGLQTPWMTKGRIIGDHALF